MGSASSVTVSKEDKSKTEKNILTKQRKQTHLNPWKNTSKLFWTLMGI